MIRKLSHVSIFVLDQERALTFYTQKLGFEIRTDAKMGDFRWLTVGPKDQPGDEEKGRCLQKPTHRAALRDRSRLPG